jgi:putative Mn2+ efflux pump MntP
MFAAVLLFLSLGLDTLAVSISLGLSGLPRLQWWRVGLVFGFFEGGMPIVGLVVGTHLSHTVGQWAGYGAAVLLILIGIQEIKEGISDDDDKPLSIEGGNLILAGLSVSLDELAIGFSLGVLRVPVGLALGYIAIQAFVLTFVGLS